MTRKNRNTAFLVLGVATFLSVLASVPFYFSAESQQFTPAQRIMIYFPTWYLWALLTPFIYFFAKRYSPKSHHPAKMLLAQVLASVIFALAHYWILFCFLRLWSVYDFFTIQTFSWKLIRYFQITTVCYAVLLWHSNQREKRELRRVSKSLDFQKFEDLRRELEPDFVIAALDSIREQIETNADEADARITGLGAYVRKSLSRSRQSLQPMEEASFEEAPSVPPKSDNHASYIDLYRELATAASRSTAFFEWTGAVATWAALLILFLFLDAVSVNTEPFIFGISPLAIMAWTIVCAALTATIRAISARYPISGPNKTANVLRHFGFSILFTVLANVLVRLHRYGLHFEEGYAIVLLYLLRMPIVTFVLYWFLLAIWHVEYFAESGRKNKRRRLVLEMEFLQAKLRVLQMQIHPHFLYNVLNSLAELVHEDTKVAVQMINGLKDFLSVTFQNKDKQQVTLREEIHFTETYLNIQKVRFQDRLDVDIQIPEEFQDICVPALILQPLVENAVRHAIGSQKEKGLVQIRGSLCNNRLQLEIKDNGPGFVLNRPFPSGVGLSNTRNRLKSLFGRMHALVLSSTPQGAIVTIQLPLERFEFGA